MDLDRGILEDIEVSEDLLKQFADFAKDIDIDKLAESGKIARLL